MKKTISFVLALFMVAGIYAQTSTQYDELIQVKTNNGKSKELNVRVSATAPVQFLPGKSHGQRSLVGYSLWGHKRVGHD